MYYLASAQEGSSDETIFSHNDWNDQHHRACQHKFWRHVSTYGGRNNERFQGASKIRDMLEHRIAISTGQSLCNLWAHLLHAIFGQVLNMFAQLPIEMS